MASRCITKNTVVGLEGGEFLLHPDANAIMEWFRDNHPNYPIALRLKNSLKRFDAIIRSIYTFRLMATRKHTSS